MQSAIVGWHVWFFREGDAFTEPAAGVCGQESKPGISPDFDAGWMDIGACETMEPAVAQQEYKLYRPNPGRLVLKDLLENMQERTFKFVVNDLSELAVELAYRTSQKLGAGQKQFNSLSSISKKGWLHMQGYDHTDTLILTEDVWGRLRASFKFDGQPTKPEFDFFQFYSSLNTGVEAIG